MKLKFSIMSFWKQEDGQDLVEYTLLLSFMALAAAGLMSGARAETKGIWSAMNMALTSTFTSPS